MEHIPNNNEMSIKKSCRGINLTNSQIYKNSHEQGKPIEAKKASLMICFVAFIFIGFVGCYLIGHEVSRAHYNDELRKRDSIYIQVQTAESNTKNGFANGK